MGNSGGHERLGSEIYLLCHYLLLIRDWRVARVLRFFCTQFSAPASFHAYLDEP